jgi:hypothetical protein
MIEHQLKEVNQHLLILLAQYHHQRIMMDNNHTRGILVPTHNALLDAGRHVQQDAMLHKLLGMAARNNEQQLQSKHLDSKILTGTL